MQRYWVKTFVTKGIFNRQAFYRARNLELVTPFVIAAVRMEVKVELRVAFESHHQRPSVRVYFMFEAFLSSTTVCEFQVVVSWKNKMMEMSP